MKKVLFPLLFFTFVLAYSQELSINSIINNRQLDNNKMSVIIYYIPFSISWRYSLSVENVKNMYFLKIESKDDNVYNFIKSIRNNNLKINDNNYRGDIRAVIEFYYDGEMIFSYALSSFNIVINGNGLQYDRRFYEFITLYLPKRYEYDYEYFLK